MDPAPVPALGPRVRTIFVVRGEKAVVPVVLGGEQCLGSLRPKRRTEPAVWQCVAMLMRGAPPEGRVVRELGGCDGIMCAGATSSGAIRMRPLVGFEMYAPEPTARSRDVYAVLPPAAGAPGDTLFGTACGFLRAQPETCLMHGDTIGVRAPAALPHPYFGRPIGLADQPFIDQTARYGETEPGVAFVEPQGTPVLAIGSGVVVHAGPSDQNGLVVAIRHDTSVTADGGGRRMVLFSTYAHNARVLVAVGQRVARGQPIARVGDTGRTTHVQVELEVHAAPADEVRAVLEASRFPAYAANPELWIDPLPGTGVVAGRVLDASGNPVSGARVYGLVKPEPQETPFSYAKTYGEPAHADPILHENFAVSDVPAGEYDVGVTIGGARVIRHVVVQAGKLTWVEFRP
jgi:murein DD-endopeptidase MepM/ murein hydrolase activator NlpD